MPSSQSVFFTRLTIVCILVGTSAILSWFVAIYPLADGNRQLAHGVYNQSQQPPLVVSLSPTASSLPGTATATPTSPATTGPTPGATMVGTTPITVTNPAQVPVPTATQAPVVQAPAPTATQAPVAQVPAPTASAGNSAPSFRASGSYTKWWATTFGTAPGYIGSQRVGTLYANTNYMFCKAWAGIVTGSNGNYNHWWLWTDLDTGGQSWVSAYYLAKWGNDAAKDNNGNEIPNC